MSYLGSLTSLLSSAQQQLPFLLGQVPQSCWSQWLFTYFIEAGTVLPQSPDLVSTGLPELQPEASQGKSGPLSRLIENRSVLITLCFVVGS